jgi:hypothetical protein
MSIFIDRFCMKERNSNKKEPYLVLFYFYFLFLFFIFYFYFYFLFFIFIFIFYFLFFIFYYTKQTHYCSSFSSAFFHSNSSFSIYLL